MSGKDKRGKKRSKSYYLKCAHKKAKRINDLDVGMRGFLVTCNTHEKEAVREMYNILNEYADDKYGPEQIIKKDDTEVGDESEEDSEEDVEKAMAREVTQMKQVATQERRFQNVDTKSRNTIFIKTIMEDPCGIAHSIFCDLVRDKVLKTRYALRMIPVSVTCKATVKDIEQAAKEVFVPHFETPFGVGLKYTSVCKIRNNNSLGRMTVLPALGKIIREMNPLHSLNHDEPDRVVVVEAIRNICCLSVVKDFFKFRKYNFHEALKSDGQNGKVSDCVDQSGDQTGKASDDVKSDGQTGKASDDVKSDGQTGKASDDVKSDGQTGKASDDVKSDGQTGKASDDVKSDGQTGKASDDVKSDGQTGKASDDVKSDGQTGKASDDVKSDGQTGKASDDVKSGVLDAKGESGDGAAVNSNETPSTGGQADCDQLTHSETATKPETTAAAE